MSSTENNAEVVVEKVVAPVEEKAADTKEIKGTKRPAEDKTPESKKAKKEENGSGNDSKIVEEETVEEFTDEDEAEDAEYDLPYDEEDEDLVEEEEDDEEDGEEYDKDA